MNDAGPLEIHIIADSTGDTAARVARAAQAQYDSVDARIIRHPRITTVTSLERVMSRIGLRGERLVIFSTLVDDELHERCDEICAERGLAHTDLLGPALNAIEHASGQQPARVVRPVGVGEDYFQRIQAMEFAIANDDGQTTAHLGQADIVLIGVSRSGKTPLSMYLGYLGYKTANIPLVKGIAPPPALYDVPSWKVVALTIDPERLRDIRTRRVKALGGRQGRDGYAELTRIYDDLDHAHAIARRLRCPAIDTTSLALEEAAGRVIEIVEERKAALVGTESQ